ncbi:glycosyltransferase family protein [Apibacter adventoris]|uniref:Glycosyl transferase family 1 n=1 Tax=Apibacter adventoris TaxID=1679466 RepID=A0A2S8AAI6_9FLAO|nr:glycosyl transferase family 1 [Apibacter adventoris]PQL91605.1 glycosyl transferase family 1 [Apibacter adventoris]
MQNRVLIVSYYWPPAGGPGVQRWLKFTKYLPDFGYEPYVYIPENPSYPIIDLSLQKEINPKVKIVKQPIWEPYKIAEKLTKNNKDFKAGQFETNKKQSFLSKASVFIRGNFFIPDARKFWIAPSVKFLSEYLQKNKINILITTGPPHSMHLIGMKLKNKIPNLKWIADFRDPWTDISYYSELKLTSFADKKHKKLEKQVMNQADIILSTSYTDKENFIKLGAKNVVCITNGFDSEILPESIKTSKFTLSYIGMLETLRNPNNLWKVLNELITQHSDFKNDFELKFVGKIANSILDELQVSPLKNIIINKGYLSHQESISEMNNSTLLLITNFDRKKSKGIIPGKLFEYLVTGKKIISIGPENADVKKILNETQAGKHFTYQDYDKLKFFILSEYEKWKNNICYFSSQDIKRFHRKKLTKQLSEIIKNL